MTKIEVLRRITLTDRNGNVVFDSGLVQSDSFVIGFLKHLYGAFISANVTIKDTGGTNRVVEEPANSTWNRFRIDAADDNDDFGIVVGTGTTAESNIDHNLATQIAHGSGAGQLDYGAHGFTAPAVVGSNVDMIVSRTFLNSSGAEISITEIGIYCHSESSATAWYFCLLRDVLTSAIPVPNGQTATVQYTIRTTV